MLRIAFSAIFTEPRVAACKVEQAYRSPIVRDMCEELAPAHREATDVISG